jgi:NTP pyrophosphatase (non-canonical NTP hydrolase)
MEAFGQEVLYIPTMPDFNLSALRLDLIEEEVQELRDGLANKSMLEIADALTDILYVVYGAGHAFGLDLDDCFHEVHSSNMTKLGADGRPLYREDGKVMKGPNYREPDLTKFVQ